MDSLSITKPPENAMRVAKEGRILVIPRGALLPPYCVKCGTPASAQSTSNTFRWHSPWIALLVFFGLLPYIIAAVVANEKMQIAIPLCSAHQKRSKKLLIVSQVLLLLCIPFGIASGAVIGDWAWGLVAGVAVSITAFSILSVRKVLRPIRIDEAGGRFKNASPVFLSLIP